MTDKTKFILGQIINLSYKDILDKDTIVDKHHAFSFLKDYIDDINNSLEKINIGLDGYWEGIKYNDHNTKDILDIIKGNAYYAIDDLLQLMALIEKIKNQVY